jgi:c-di-GMP-binding flagellar brake protein YcgR
MGTDQRQSPRYPYRSELELEIAGAARTQRTLAVNLSEGGVCFEHREALRKDDRVRVRFMTDEPFDLPAQVRYSTRVATTIGEVETGAVCLVGVQFVGLSEAQKKQLATLVEELAASDDE